MVKSKMSDSINQLVESGLSSTENGYWTITFKELSKRFGIDLAKDIDERDDFIEALTSRAEVKNAKYNEDGINIAFSPYLCKNLTIKGITPMLERSPTLVAFVAEMSEFVDRYAQKAVDRQINGIAFLNSEDIRNGAYIELFDEELFVGMLLDHPEIEEIDNDMDGYILKISEPYIKEDANLRELDEDAIIDLCKEQDDTDTEELIIKM